MKYRLPAILIFLALSSGCAAPGRKEAGPSALERLQSGMTMRDAVEILGPATTAAVIRESPRSEKYHSLTYTNTLLNPGVVELIFAPGLIEIRRDGRLYRDLRR
jgi:hypothetical protein